MLSRGWKPTSSSTNGWKRCRAISIFGIPATFAMFALAMMALLRTRQEARRFATVARRNAAPPLDGACLAAGAENGSRRPADRRHRARLQQPAYDHQRQSRYDAAPAWAKPASAEALHELVAKLTQPLERAIIGAKSAAQLTHRLLAFSRRQPLKPGRLDLNNLVASISELLRRTLGEGINIETVLAGGLWPAFADQNQLENALLNLAINARDAMPEGGRLTIETANIYLDEAYARRFNDVAAGQYVMISVDGLPAPAFRPRCWKKFSSRSSRPRRWGRAPASASRWCMASSSSRADTSASTARSGQGTTVKIYLPRMTGEDAGAAVPAGAEPALLPLSGARARRPSCWWKTTMACANMRPRALSELGYTVLAARDGDEALAILERTPRIDILFTDVVLPGGINGRELANRVLAKRPGLPVLYTTGYTRNAIIHHGRLDADVHLLSKPYTEQDLAMKIAGVARRHAPQAGRSRPEGVTVEPAQHSGVTLRHDIAPTATRALR